MREMQPAGNGHGHGRQTRGWVIEGKKGRNLVSPGEMAEWLYTAELCFGGGKALWIDYGQADEVRAWLEARGVVIPAEKVPA